MFHRSHKRVTLDTGDVQITKQSHKDECDIHRILKQYQRTGIITHVQKAQAQFLDLPSSLDFQESLNLIREGEAAFASLPATVRAHFDHNPERFLNAFYDPSQAPALRALGLIPPEPPQAASEPSPSP